MNNHKGTSTISLNPLVSIVTPSYNSMPYIKATVKSVQSQTYINIEHIVMDGGSTDGTIEFLQSQTQLIWKSESDRGQSHALNKGFHLAKGEIIGWLNSDDTYEPNAITEAVKFLTANPYIGMVYSDVQIIDEKDQLIGKLQSKPFNLELLLTNNYIKQPTVFIKRAIIDQLKGVDEDLHFVMDREFWLRIGLAGYKVGYLENCYLANFRLIPGTKSYEQNSIFQKEWVEVLEKSKTISVFNDKVKIKYKRILRSAHSQYHVSLAIDAINKNAKKESIKELITAIKHNNKLLLNRGILLLFFSALLGFKIGRLRKFKKGK